MPIKRLKKTSRGNSKNDINETQKISFVYNKEILSKLERIVPQAMAISIQEAVFDNDAKRLQSLLDKLLRESVSLCDTTKEIFYHGLMLGLCVVFSDSYTVTSIRESGDGRYDIQLMPQDVNRPGFIFELKAEKKCDDLKDLAQVALQQIIDNKYDTEMLAKGVQTIVKYGVAFSGKYVEIASASR